eukprot:c33222_g1_i1.p1 GENE.c33222_g1_i1~~c33222_g1_i1.p1  ORF type:complete len:322 (+),score=75.21 c33222_g1_i1:156-1121(+)
MGKLLSKFQNSPSPVDVFVDFANAQPQNAEEEAVFTQIQTVIDQSSAILGQLVVYTGCGELIREAIVNPSNPETGKRAWEAVIPKVHLLKEFFEFSLTLQENIPALLRALCTPGNAEVTLTNMQALTRQLADLMNFVLRFDDAKMGNPAIQNDFSFYRRTLNKMKMTDPDVELPIKDDLANRMSLFYAYPTPMMRALSETVVAFVNSNALPRNNVTDVFALLGNACYSMVHLKRFDTDQLNFFCLRALTASIIVFDSADPAGAFHKRSPIHIKQAIQTLKNFQPATPGEADTSSLINAIRFTTVHLTDEDTPSSITALLEN